LVLNGFVAVNAANNTNCTHGWLLSVLLNFAVYVCIIANWGLLVNLIVPLDHQVYNW